MKARKQQTVAFKTTHAESIETALSVLQSNDIVTVPQDVWVAVRAREAHKPARRGHAGAKESHEAFIYEGRFVLLRGEVHKAVLWCETPQIYSVDRRAWISHGLLAGYMNQDKQYCLLQLQSDDQVVPAPKGMLKPHELEWIHRRLQQQAWETPTSERDHCKLPFSPPTAPPTPSPVTADTSG